MLCIMRHGRTQWNAERRLQGRSDIPLNEEGRQMARDARIAHADLHFDICYCSPLIRARETAELFLEGSGTPIVTDDRLAEMGFGAYEGMQDTWHLPITHPMGAFFHEPGRYVADNGAETMDELFERTGSFIAETLRPAVAAGKNVLVVGHGAMNCALIAQLRGTPRERLWDGMTDNGKITRFDITD